MDTKGQMVKDITNLLPSSDPQAPNPLFLQVTTCYHLSFFPES